jgi:hypothetical protein
MAWGVILYVVNAHQTNSQDVGDLNPLRGPSFSGLGLCWVGTAGRSRNCTSEMGLKNFLRHTHTHTHTHIHGLPLYGVNVVFVRDTAVPVTVLTCSLFIIYCIKCEMFYPASYFTSHIVLRIVLGPGRNFACPGTSGTTYLCDRKNYVVFFPP